MECIVIFKSESEAHHYQRYIGHCRLACCGGYMNALVFTYHGIFD
jgi:hypothetical protein